MLNPIRPAAAQSSVQWAPELVHPGETVSFFADWPGREHLDGLGIRPADGWELTSVTAIGHARSDRTEFSILRTGDGYIAESGRRLLGRQRLAITLIAPTTIGASRVDITPTSLVHDRTGAHHAPILGGAFKFNVDVLRANPPSGLALKLTESRRVPVRVERTLVADDEPIPGLTVSFWLKTVDLDKVVLSTWDGEDHHDYPFEFVIEADGSLRVYTGRNGMHYSVGNPSPVADGSWHHIAYSSDFGSGFSRLAIDGIEMDARLLPEQSGGDASRITIGGRDAADGLLVGVLDELLITPVPEDAATMRLLGRVPVAGLQLVAGAVALGFDRRRIPSAVEGVDGETDLVASNLSLHLPVSDVVAEFRPGSVEISWMVERPEEQRITIERSLDGVRFEPVHTTTIGRADVEFMSDREVETFQDLVGPESAVYYYRVTQEFADESVIRSRTLKVGLGTLELPTTVELVGNSPNPFSTSTEVYFRVLETTSLRLSVWSLSGHLIEVLAAETREPGLHRIPFEAGVLPSGAYFLRLESNEGVQTHKLVVSR